MAMRVAVIGAGVLGCIYSGRLARGGCEVWLVDFGQEHMALIKERGLILSEDGKDWLVALKGAEAFEELPALDMALIFVKGKYTGQVAMGLKQVMKKDGWIINLQNGLGPWEMFAGIVFPNRLLKGITNFGGEFVGPGEVRITAYGQTLVTSISGERPEGIESIINLLNGCGLNAQYLEDMSALIWEKLIVAATIEPLTAILRVPNGHLFKSPYAMAVINEIVAEALTVADRKGIVIRRPDFANHIMRIVKLTANQKSGMLCDVLNRRATDIDMLNGAIVKEGEACGVATPVNALITALVRSIEEAASN